MYFSSLFTWAQSARAPINSVYTRLSAYSLNNTDAFSFTANQASLAKMNNFTAGVFGERRFMLKDLTLYHFSIKLPAKIAQIGITGNHSGGLENKESSLGIAYGRRISEKLDIGAQFNYYTVRISGYGSATSINFEGGLLFHLTDQLILGIHSYNPTNSKLGNKGEEKLPAIYTVGLGYETSDKFLVSGEIQKQEDEPININAGLQYSFGENLFARAGISSATSTYYIGVGVLLKSLRVDATASVHPQLGISPGLMLIYKSLEKEE